MTKNKLMKKYQCCECGGESEAGSFELLNEWKKYYTIVGYYKEKYVNYYCGSCWPRAQEKFKL